MSFISNRFCALISILLIFAGCATENALESINKPKSGTISPELFGAIGDGITDDTEAIAKCFQKKMDVVLNNNYLITKTITLESSISGKGKILFGADEISIRCVGKSFDIKGITFDYQEHYGRLLKLVGASNVTIDDCSFINVGTTQQSYANGMIMITDGCRNIRIKNSRFLHCKSSISSSAQGIWIQHNSRDKINQYIYVDNCYFEDFQTINDADAIKVLGDNYNCYLYVNNCEFYKCGKRAMKFQGRKCYSSNNKIYVTEPMYCAIAYQRGYGVSSNDSIIINYDGNSTIDPNAGLLYRAITIAKGNVTVKGFKMIEEKGVVNNHQVAIGIVSYGLNDKKIKGIVIKDCYFNNGGSLLKVSDNVEEIKRLNISNTVFDVKSSQDMFLLGSANISKSHIRLDVITDEKKGVNAGLSQRVEHNNVVRINKSGVEPVN